MNSSRFRQKTITRAWRPIYQYFGNLLPHFLNPNKQITFGGNFYAHEMGSGLAEDDYSTGISFSPVAEAFHCEGWGGILWLLPVIWILLFSSVDFVVGDMTKYPWGLMVVVWIGARSPRTACRWHDLFYGLWQLWNDAGDHRGHAHCADSGNPLPGQGGLHRQAAGWLACGPSLPRRRGESAAPAGAALGAIGWRCATMKAAAIAMSTFQHHP